jgi:ATP-dependent Lon protease
MGNDSTAADRGTRGGGSVFVIPGDAMVIVPIRNVVLFPGMILPLTIGREASILAAQQAVKTEQPVGILLQREAEVEAPGPDDLCLVGTVANILRYVTLQDNAHVIVCQGLQRFRVAEYLPGYPFPVARIARIDEAEASRQPDRSAHDPAPGARARSPAISAAGVAGAARRVRSITQPAALADLVASVSELKLSDRQRVLETVDLLRRLDIVLDCLLGRLEVLRLSRELDERTKASIDQRQREYLLREQLRSIQKELGEGDAGNGVEIDALRKAIAEAGMPEEVATQANKELQRLERMADGSAEYSMVRAYLDWLVELPWREPEPDSIEIAEARRILDADHFGLDQDQEAHRRVSCRAQAQPGRSRADPVLRRSARRRQDLARAVDCPCPRTPVRACFARRRARRSRNPRSSPHLHRRLPGNIIQAIRKAGSRGCVMMLDEIDKLGAASRAIRRRRCSRCSILSRTTASATTTWRLPFDLSRMLFITTANVLDNIPGPLRDRMEIIQLPGYTQEEKLEIARRYLVGRQIAQNGLQEGQIEFDGAALQAIIRDYTREAGVRSLEREIGAVCRRVAVRLPKARAGDAGRRGRSRRHPRAGQVRQRSRPAHRAGRRRHRPGMDAGRWRHPVHRSEPNRRRRQADPHRPTRRRHEGVGAGGADAGEDACRQRSVSTPAPSTEAIFMCTCRPGRSPRTARAPASRCSSPWHRCSSTARCATTPR